MNLVWENKWSEDLGFAAVLRHVQAYRHFFKWFHRLDFLQLQIQNKITSGTHSQSISIFSRLTCFLVQKWLTLSWLHDCGHFKSFQIPKEGLFLSKTSSSGARREEGTAAPPFPPLLPTPPRLPSPLPPPPARIIFLPCFPVSPHYSPFFPRQGAWSQSWDVNKFQH